LVCNSFNHSSHCPSYRNNALKGAAAVVGSINNNNNNYQPKQYVFNQSEVNLLGKSLEAIKYFITKNQQMFQQPNDILKELDTASNILSVRQNNNNNNESNLKGASDINSNKFQALDNIRNMFGLGNNIVRNDDNQLKGASVPNNIPLCDKTKVLINIKNIFGLH
jgi:hypothetical protein